MTKVSAEEYRGHMSKIRERLIGGGITVAVAGGAFWGLTAANADDDVPPAEPEPPATIEPGHYSTVESQDPIEYVAPVVEAPPAEIPVEAPPVSEPAPAVPQTPAPVDGAGDPIAAPPGNIDIGDPPPMPEDPGLPGGSGMNP